jgi:hypothetical protein
MKIMVARPCYSSRRTRGVTRVTIYDVEEDKVIEEYYPYDCKELLTGRKQGETLVIEFNPEKHTVFYRYKTNSDRGLIIFYHIPPHVDLKLLERKLMRMYRYREVNMELARQTNDLTLVAISPYYYMEVTEGEQHGD